MRDVRCLPTMELLREHIHQVLCGKDQLDPQQTPLQQSILLQRNKPCGIFFQVNGPRLLKNYAVWAGEENRIIFYDAVGERFGETVLSESPALPRKNAA